MAGRQHTLEQRTQLRGGDIGTHSARRLRAAQQHVHGRMQVSEQFAGQAQRIRQVQPGDVVMLDLPMPVRLTAGHPRADAMRGCLAIERGPLVYCLEQADLPADGRLDDVAIDAGGPLRAVRQPGLLGDVVTVTARGYLRRPDGPGTWWPYGPPDRAARAGWQEITLTAVPYFAWANRGPGAMRVWIPRSPGR